MQTSFLSLFDDAPPARDWVEECSGRWVRYSHPWRLMVQQDQPDTPWRWGCHRWPGLESRQDGEAATAQEGARLAEQALLRLIAG